jgi:predicted dehydrogenase
VNDAEIRVGVLGATGFIGKPYRLEMRDSTNVRIVALCARRRDLLESAATEDGADLVTDDWREVVEHPDVNFVVVATPDALHHEAVLACAKAGKHLLCEKPVGKTATEAVEMWQAYRTAGTLAHFVPFWTRYIAIFQKAKEIIESGRLGEIRGVVYRWHNPRPASMPLTWRDDANLSAGGSIADVGSHAYDTVCWLLGEEATRVLAHADTITPAKADLGAINLDEALSWGANPESNPKTRQGTTPDYASISWEFSSGAVGVLMVSHASFFRKGLCPELELHGTDASLAINRATGDVFIGLPDASPELIENTPDQGFGNRFEKHVFPVVRSVLAGDSPPVHPNLEDGWRVQCFTDAALQSAKIGGWVNVTGG